MADREAVRKAEQERWEREYREITVAHACLDNSEDIKGVLTKELKKELARRNFDSEAEAVKFVEGLTVGVVNWITRWGKR